MLMLKIGNEINNKVLDVNSRIGRRYEHHTMSSTLNDSGGKQINVCDEQNLRIMNIHLEYKDIHVEARGKQLEVHIKAYYKINKNVCG